MIKANGQEQRRPSARARREAGAETRARIIDAALDALRDEGYAGATARSIATGGDFNPALIFYHFGGVDDLFLAALERTSVLRLERYRGALQNVSGLADLIATLRTLYAEDVEAAHIAAVQELVAASAFSTSMGPRIVALMQPWFAFSEELIARILKGTALEGMVSPADLAFAMVALYLGLETMTRLTGGDPRRVRKLFSSAQRGAAIVEPLLGGRRRGAAARAPAPVVLE